MTKPKQSRDLIVVGALKGAHGVRGDVKVKSFTADPEAVFDYGPLTDGTGKTLLTPLSARAAKDHFIVRTKESLQKEAWDALRGTLLYVERDRLPAPDEDEFYIEDLVGLQVYSGGNQAVGRIKSVQNFGADDLLEIDVLGLPATVLVPFTRADVPVVDLAAKRVVVPELAEWARTDLPD